MIWVADIGTHRLHLVEHRIGIQKKAFYEEAIHMPLMVRWPDMPAGLGVERLLTNNDLAPTLPAITGVVSPAYADGQSILLLLTDPGRPWR